MIYRKMMVHWESLMLCLLAYEDLRGHELHRLSLLMLFVLRAFQKVSTPPWLLLFILLFTGFFLERRDEVPFGEGDAYLLSALSLFHHPFELLSIMTLALWLLLPWTIHGLWKMKRHHEKIEGLALSPAIFVARQGLCIAQILAGSSRWL